MMSIHPSAQQLRGFAHAGGRNLAVPVAHGLNAARPAQTVQKIHLPAAAYQAALDRPRYIVIEVLPLNAAA